MEERGDQYTADEVVLQIYSTQNNLRSHKNLGGVGSSHLFYPGWGPHITSGLSAFIFLCFTMRPTILKRITITTDETQRVLKHTLNESSTI